MAKSLEFYKGKRKKRDLTIIPMVIIVTIITAVVVLFYSMQKYAVITKDDVSVVMPFMQKDEETADGPGGEAKTFEKVDAKLSFANPDYSAIEATAGKGVPELRAIFVPWDEVNKDKLTEYAGRLNSGNALVLEMKPREGVLLWNTGAEMAYAYALSGETEKTIEVESTIAGLKEQGVYLVAQISCCIDKMLCSSSATVTLKNSLGTVYTDDNGMWLDPYNQGVRNYVVDLANELYDIGFDEVVLADVMHPGLEEEETVYYTRQMSTPQSPVNAVCGFAVYVAEQLADRPGYLSIYCDSAVSLVKDDTATGQNAVLFMKLFDRVYYRTDKYAYTFNLDDIKGNVKIGKANDRLVPVVENYLPENTTWVYIETEEDES